MPSTLLWGGLWGSAEKSRRFSALPCGFFEMLFASQSRTIQKGITALQPSYKPDARLCSALSYITRGGRIADIGTDHAYLPIYLIQEGVVSHALACDINQGPIQSAKANIAAAGLSQRIDTLQTDGLFGVEPFAPDDVLIFGMGGELIARILSDAPWVAKNKVNLILQPMSKVSILRKYLTENGFSITGESITYVDKYYQTLAARYTGVRESYSAVELLVGRLNIQNRPPHFQGLVRHEIHVLEMVIQGKSRAANPEIKEEAYIKRCLEELL